MVAPEGSATSRPATRAAAAARWPREPNTIELIVTGPIARTDIATLCERARTLLASGDADPLMCDVGGVADPDAVTVDVLARLQLTARRAGRQIGLRNASPELQDLLDFVGLSGVVPLSAGSRVEARRQAEEREIRGSIKEEGDPADPIA